MRAPPSSRASAPPSAYPSAQQAVPISRNASAEVSAPDASCRTNASVTASPASAASQNAQPGRSPARATAASAVAAGSTAITTAPCAESLVTSAMLVNRGKPTTTPAATTASRTSCRRPGRGARTSARYAHASRPAIAARPKAISHGSNPSRASFVAGNENENAMMPTHPSASPAVRRSPFPVTGCRAVALPRTLMPDGNTAAAVIKELEAAAAAGRPGDRLPSVRELMQRHGAGPATVQRAVHRLVRRGVVDARPGRGTFVAAAPAVAAAAPDHGWQTVALGARTLDASALEELLRPPPAGVLVLSRGYLPAELQPRGALGQALGRAARRPGAWSQAPAEGLAPLRELVRRQAGRRPRRRARDRGRRRAVRADRLSARPRSGGRRGGRRVAHVPRGAGGGAGREPRAGAGADRRARDPPRPAGRRAGRLRRPARLLPADATRTRTARCSPPSGAPMCSPPCARPGRS